MKIDIQKIFSQYGITNTMHNDAYDWWRRRYLRNGNTKNKYNFIRDIILCVSFIGVYIGILLFLGLLINGKVISELSKNPLIAVIFLLLFLIIYMNNKIELRREVEEKKELDKEETLYVEYKNKEQKIAKDYETDLNNFYDKIYRKRVNETFKKNFQKYEEFINVCDYINHYLIFANIHTYEHKEYAKKRGYSLILHDYSSLSKKILPKIEEDYSLPKPIKSNSIKNNFNPQKIDWVELNKSNSKLGKYGESIIMGLEKEYLIENGMKNLAEKMEWISQTKGDGAGYDILSYNLDGSYKYIEVKTTCVSENESFYISDNELNFFRTHQDSYFIYRLFIDKNSDEPTLKVFNSTDILKLNLQPVSYKVIIKQ